MRSKPIVIGNWKMYKTSKEAVDYIQLLAPLITATRASVFIAPPFTAITKACMAAEKTNITIGSQNMSDELEGAYTGEISSLMLKAEGAEFTILGHSERRKCFKEDNAFLNKKVIRALEDGLIPVFCIGETQEERKNDLTHAVLSQQITLGLKNIPKEDAQRIIVAYEPVWAIGTGKVATAKIAQEAHSFTRKCLKELFDGKTASKIPIVYGGSVKPDNFADLITKEDIDGALVGGASLNPESFAKIINLC